MALVAPVHDGQVRFHAQIIALKVELDRASDSNRVVGSIDRGPNTMNQVATDLCHLDARDERELHVEGTIDLIGFEVNGAFEHQDNGINRNVDFKVPVPLAMLIWAECGWTSDSEDVDRLVRQFQLIKMARNPIPDPLDFSGVSGGGHVRHDLF